MSKDILQHKDLEYDALEREDLLSGEPRYVEDEVRNTNIAMVLAGLSGLLCLVAMVLTWVLYFRERTRTFLWHAIWLIFAMLFAFGCAGWAFLANSSAKLGKEPNAMFSMLVYLGSLIFFVYMVVESLWFIFYRPVHFSYLLGLSTDQGLWNARMTSGSSFDEGWTSSRRMMWWVALFTLISGVSFGFVAYTVRSIVSGKFNLTRIGLYAACLFMVLSGFMMIYWAQECLNYQALTTQDFGGVLIQALKVLGIIGVVLGVLNAITNFLKFKFIYFALGLLMIIYLVLVLASAGNLWRNIRYAQNIAVSAPCQSSLISIHENNLSDICINGGKYLPAGSTCTKEYLVNRWEGGSTNDLRFLNPNCCTVGQSFYYYPFMLLAYWTTIMAFCAAIAVVCDFYLADTSEFLSNASKQSSIIDYLGLALVVLLAIGWILYFIFRKKTAVADAGTNFEKTFIDPANNPANGFDIVPSRIVSSATPPKNSNGCFFYNPSTMITPNFSNTDPVCTTNCFERVSLLSNNSRIINPPSANPPNIYWSQSYQQTLFPGCSSTNNSFLVIWGTTAQIQAALKTIQICPNVVGTIPNLLFFHDQVPANTLSTFGFKNGELNTASNTPTDDPSCANGFSTASSATVCTGACKLSHQVANAYAQQQLKGSLYYISNGQTINNVSNTVNVRGLVNGVESVPVSNYQLFAGGIFILNGVPRYTDSDYTLTLQIYDSANVYLNKSVDVLIPRVYPNYNDTLSAGSIRLLSKNGTFCAATDTACLNSQGSSTGNVLIMVKDGSNTSNMLPLQGASINLLSGFSNNGPLYTSSSSDASGTALFKNVPFGAYRAVVSSPNYDTQTTDIDLQDPTFSAVPLVLVPSSDNYTMRITADMNAPGMDFDLKMNILSDKNAFCQVSPYNKYCAYSAHLSDVTNGVGEEIIGIKNMSVANYITMVAPSPAYSASCPAASAVQNNLGHFGSDWNWDIIKKSSPMEKFNIAVNLFSGVFGNGNVLERLPRVRPPVETESQANTLKDLINFGGFALPKEQWKKFTTAIQNSNDKNKTVINSQASAQSGPSNITTTNFTTFYKGGQVNGINVTNSTKLPNNTVINETIINANDTKQQSTINNQLKTYNLTNPNGSSIISAQAFSNGTANNGNIETSIIADTVQKGFSDISESTTAVKNLSSYDPFLNSNTTRNNTKGLTAYPNGTKYTFETTKTSQNTSDVTTNTESTAEAFNTPGGENGTRQYEKSTITSSNPSTSKNENSKEKVAEFFKNGTNNSAEIILKNSTGTLQNQTIDKNTMLISNPDGSSNKTEAIVETLTDSLKTLVSNQINNLGTTAAKDNSSSEIRTETSNYKNGSIVELKSTRTSFLSLTGTNFTNVTRVEHSSIDNTTTEANYTRYTYPNGTIAYVSNTLITVLNSSAGTQTRDLVILTNMTYANNKTNVSTTNSTHFDVSGLDDPVANVSYIYTTIYDYGKGSLATYVNDALVSNVSAPVVSTRRVLEGRIIPSSIHSQGGAQQSNNFLIGNCFNGWGPSSVAYVGNYTATEPSWNDCIPVMAGRFPNLTLSSLRKAMGQ